MLNPSDYFKSILSRKENLSATLFPFLTFERAENSINYQAQLLWALLQGEEKIRAIGHDITGFKNWLFGNIYYILLFFTQLLKLSWNYCPRLSSIRELYFFLIYFLISAWLNYQHYAIYLFDNFKVSITNFYVSFFFLFPAKFIPVLKYLCWFLLLKETDI